MIPLAVAPLSIAHAQSGPPQLTVSVVEPLAKRVDQWDEYSGRFEAVQLSEVRSRVSGFIEEIHFKDGQLVKEGDLLFTLDRRQYQLAVESANAEVARFAAQVTLAETDLQRAEPLLKSRAISDQTFDQRRASLTVARAQLLAAQTASKTAALNLEWSEVRAPISGMISDRKVDVGNLVAGGQAASTTLLAIIVTQDPIHFLFDISEADFLRYARHFLVADRAQSRNTENPVRIKLADEDGFKHTGHLDFLDNSLNPRSGTLRGRAIVENKSGLLKPGLFGRLQLSGGEADVLLIPDSAIVSDQARKIVLVVDDKGMISGRAVELGNIFDGLRLIRSGLTARDRVVIDGLANPAVRPGVQVKPELKQITTATR